MNIEEIKNWLDRRIEIVKGAETMLPEGRREVLEKFRQDELHPLLAIQRLFEELTDLQKQAEKEIRNAGGDVEFYGDIPEYYMGAFRVLEELRDLGKDE